MDDCAQPELWVLIYQLGAEKMRLNVEGYAIRNVGKSGLVMTIDILNVSL